MTTGKQLENAFAGLQSVLDKMSLDNQETRKVVSSLLQPVARTARKLIPKPGYPGDKPQFKPLRDTIRVVIRDYGSVWYGAVGPQWPAGAHGHLVEGYKRPARHFRPKPGNTKGVAATASGGRLKTTPFIGPAYKQHESSILSGLKSHVASTLKRKSKNG